MKLKKLPIGIQTFENIRKEDYLYIDKTKEALELIETFKYAFLSRPRRFGKSLFLDTLQDIFEGKKELFEELYIYDKYNFEDKYPVIKIDWSGDFQTLESTKQVAKRIFELNQKHLGITCEDDEDVAVCFNRLIEESYQKYKKPVVILIDEYDKPILDNIEDTKRANENREFLRAIYVQLKANDRYIKFAFLTGVSKFSKASIFSGLNNLEDITLNKKFGNICGYTHKNIENEFLPYLDGVDLQKVKKWYNGYNFLKDPVYNPFDILLFIKNEYIYKNYWFETATPSFLIKLIKKNNYFLPKLSNLMLDEKILNSFDIENLDLEVILYQAGYLTIDTVNIDEDDDIIYTLKLPNLEVKKSFYQYIITSIYQDKTLKRKSISKALRDVNLEEFKNSLVSIFASLPTDNFRKNSIANYEGFYASVIFTYLSSFGLDIVGEDVTNQGYIDLTLKADNAIYIIEFKMGDSNALEQIKQKKYYEKYLNLQQDIYIIGINFDKDKKNISRFEWEQI